MAASSSFVPWPRHAHRPDTLTQAVRIRSLKPLSDGAGHTLVQVRRRVMSEEHRLDILPAFYRSSLTRLGLLRRQDHESPPAPSSDVQLGFYERRGFEGFLQNVKLRRSACSVELRP